MAKEKQIVEKGDSKVKALDDAVKALKERFGEGSIMKLGEVEHVSVDTIPTGSLSLDLALGVGGIPRGRIVEVFGPESSGKTTLALHIVAEAQKRGGTCAFVDAEHALDPEYAKRIGVKINDLLISQPDNGEQALEIVESLVRSNSCDVVVIDSVAALTPKAEIEGEMGASHMGLQARLMSQALRKLTAIADKSNTSIIFINQIRHKIGVMFGCLNYKSVVNLKNHKSEWIGRIVNQKKKVEIYSYNWKNRTIETKPVSGWFSNGAAEKFLQITTYKPSGNGRAQVACTPNHPILTPIGWRRAEDLKKGDQVLVGCPQKLNSLQMEIIRGSLLGDGALSFSASKNLGVRFRMGHAKKQKPYLLWKASFFSNIAGCISENRDSDVFFDLTPLPELYSLKKMTYLGKYKFLSSDFVSNLFPLSLAIWYMDDGHLDIRDTKEKNTKARITICVEAIYPESRVLLQKHLEEKYGIETRLGTQGHKIFMFFDQHNSDKFMQLVQKYIYPPMNYKLLPKYHSIFDLRPKFSEPVWKPLAVPIVDIHEKPRTRSMTRFDIGVRGTHNFLADGIIVHNSPETTTGGNALKFYSSVRLDVRRSAQIKKGDDAVGNRVTVKVVKNKVAAPFRTAEFDVMYNEGISREGDLISCGVKYGVLAKAGPWIAYNDLKLGQGSEAAKQYLKENPSMVKTLAGDIMKAWEKSNITEQ